MLKPHFYVVFFVFFRVKQNKAKITGKYKYGKAICTYTVIYCEKVSVLGT